MVQDDDDPASLLRTNHKRNKQWSTATALLAVVVVIVTCEVSGSVGSKITTRFRSESVAEWCSGDRQLVHLALSLQKESCCLYKNLYSHSIYLYTKDYCKKNCI